MKESFCCPIGHRLFIRIRTESGDLQRLAVKASRQRDVKPAMLAQIAKAKADVAGVKESFEQHVKGCAPTSR